MEYQYPFSIDWSTEEVIEVISFFQLIERAYEKGVKKEELMDGYRKFKTIVPGKADERKITDEFEEVSHFSTYRVIQQAKKADENTVIKM